MKLTKAQVETLVKVERGEVMQWRSTRTSKPDTIYGARKDTIKRLLENRLIDYPKLSMDYVSFAYILTDAGRAALESARKKEGK